MVAISYFLNPEMFLERNWVGPTQLDNERRRWVLTGMVDLGDKVKGSGSQWKEEQCEIILDMPGSGGEMYLMEEVALLITLNGISNNDHAVNAGWAIDSWELVAPSSEVASNGVHIRVTLRVRDIDGYILRLGYMLDLIVRKNPT